MGYYHSHRSFGVTTERLESKYMVDRDTTYMSFTRSTQLSQLDLDYFNSIDISIQVNFHPSNLSQNPNYFTQVIRIPSRIV